jgi:hypothetical protein
LVYQSPDKGFYPAALPSPALKWGHGERIGGLRILLKGPEKRSDDKKLLSLKSGEHLMIGAKTVVGA